MRKSTRPYWLVLACFAVCATSCKRTASSSPTTITAIRAEDPHSKNEADEETGMAEMFAQEFKATRDPQLGIVPRDRLISAHAAQLARWRQNPQLRAAAVTWTERGPNNDAVGTYANGRPGNAGATSGRMRAIHVDLSDATNRTVWVGGVNGGLWKTTDITAANPVWTPINDFMGNIAIASICQNPANTQIMYAGTGEKTLNMDAARGGGVWKSVDGGATWTLLNSTTSFWNVSRIACDASGNVYVAGIGNSTGVRRSTDGGATWTNITPTGMEPNICDLKIIGGALHIVSGYQNNAFLNGGTQGYRYATNPATVTSAAGWTTPVVNFGTTIYNVELAGVGTTVYALVANSSNQTPIVYKSTNGGANWAATTSMATGGLNGVSSGQGWYCLAITVDPTDANKVIVGGLNTYRTINGGTNWAQVSSWVSGTGGPAQYVHADIQYGVWNNDQVLLATDGGIFYSADDGTNWFSRNNGLRLKQFYSVAVHPTTTNYFLAGAQDNGCHKMTNAGLGASTEVTGGDGAFVHIDQDDPQYQFGSYTYNDYRRSNDGGNSWAQVEHSSTGQFINPTDYDDGNDKLYCGAASSQYVRWDDPQTGYKFSTVSVAAFSGEVTAVTVSPYTANRVYFGTESGRVVRVDNAHTASPTATNLTVAGMPSNANVSSIAMGTTDNFLLATYSNYGVTKVWYSSNGGTNWTSLQSGSLPDIPVRWAMFYPDDNTKAILGTELGVYETDLINGTSTVWTQNSTMPFTRVTMLQYRRGDGTLVASTHGRGVWTTQIPRSTPRVRFELPYATKSEGAVTVSGCRRYRDYTAKVLIDAAPTGTATLTLSTGGTAVSGTDYDITTNGSFVAPSNTLTFASGSATAQNVTIRVYDDLNVEAAKTLTLSYTISGSTNAVAASNNQTYTLTISDDDAAPTSALSAVAIGNNAFDLTENNGTPFDARQTSKKALYLYRADELRAAGVKPGRISSIGFTLYAKNSTRAFQNLNINLAQTTNSLLVDYPSVSANYSLTNVYSSASYSTVLGLNTFNLTGSFAWDGYSNLVVEVCYNNGSTSSTAGVDWVGGHVDGNTYDDGNTIWQNGIACGTNYSSVGYAGSGLKPSIQLTTFNPVGTVLNTTASSYLGLNNTVHYYSSTGEILATIANAGGQNFGCTQVTIDRDGTAAGGNAFAKPFWNNANSTWLTAKTFQVVPTTNNTGASYTITLYYSAAEKAGWEAATGNLWSNIKIIKVKSQIKNYSPATMTPDGPNPGAWQIENPVHGTFGSDYTLTFTFNTGFSGFAAGIPGGNPLPVSLLSFTGRIENKTGLLDWSTSLETNSKDFEVEKSTDGVNYYTIGRVPAAGNSSARRDYAHRDPQLAERNYYRLKMNDVDGRFRHSQVVLLQHGGKQNVWVVNNPFRDHLDLRFARNANRVELQLVSGNGAVVARTVKASVNGQVRWELPGHIGRGTYVLQVVADGERFSEKLVKQ